MRGEDDGLAFGANVVDEFAHDLAAEHVESKCRLVEQQDRRLVNERAGEVNALFLAGAQGGAAAVQEFVQAQKPAQPAQLAPRVGIAYRLGDKTTIRTGAGIFYALNTGGSVLGPMTSTAPYFIQASLTSSNTTPELILSTLFVRFRDIGQIWELLLQLLFYASPIIIPVAFLPPWFQPISFLNPFVQIMQDTRAVVIFSMPVVTAARRR